MDNNKKTPTVLIHGNEYVTVATRVKLIHDDLRKAHFSITTEILNDNPVVVKATVTTPIGVFTGTSAANPSKTIEKQSPYEVAETSAIGRALGFAGYGVTDSIASVDEIVVAQAKSDPVRPSYNAQKIAPKAPIVIKPMDQDQINQIGKLLIDNVKTEEDLTKAVLAAFKVEDWRKMNYAQAGAIIKKLNTMLTSPLPEAKDDIDLNEIDKGIEAQNVKQKNN